MKSRSACSAEKKDQLVRQPDLLHLLNLIDAVETPFDEEKKNAAEAGSRSVDGCKHL